MNKSRRALLARHKDKCLDLNDLEMGFIAGVVDSAASFTCTTENDHLHWMIRVCSRNANFIVALRTMTGVGEFLENDNKKQIFWRLGILNGYFLMIKILPFLQIKQRHAKLMIDYREQSLITKIKNLDMYAKEMRKLNDKQSFVKKRFNDDAFIGYFFGLLETKGMTMIMSNGPIIALSDVDAQILKEIKTRIGGTINNDAIIWHDWEQFNFIYKLTENKLFSLQEPMKMIKQYEEGKLSVEELIKKSEDIPKTYQKIDIKNLMTKIDELAKSLKS
jgi:hypothetical protein